MNTLGLALAIVVSILGIIGMCFGAYTWVFNKGRQAASVEAGIAATAVNTAKIDKAAERISRIDQVNELLIAQSDKIRRQDSDIKGLLQAVASLDGRKVSSSTLMALQRPQSSHDWFVDAPIVVHEEEKKKP